MEVVIDPALTPQEGVETLTSKRALNITVISVFASRSSVAVMTSRDRSLIQTADNAFSTGGGVVRVGAVELELVAVTEVVVAGGVVVELVVAGIVVFPAVEELLVSAAVVVLDVVVGAAVVELEVVVGA
mmetsp:Transcript_72132/g.150687  ORF Transcript_72132/g.150687 Transcript_72132/m.150687 type:complete len:129 (+) Transcript_72132:2179-2565(+)